LSNVASSLARARIFRRIAQQPQRIPFRCVVREECRKPGVQPKNCGPLSPALPRDLKPPPAKTPSDLGVGDFCPSHARVVVFLRTIGANAGVRSQMKHEGYSIDDDREGWRLLNVACAMRPDALDPPDEARRARR
jgi:hypothetical protein